MQGQNLINFSVWGNARLKNIRPLSYFVIPLFVFLAVAMSLALTFASVETIEREVSVLHLEVAERTKTVILNSINNRKDEQVRLGQDIVRTPENIPELLSVFLRNNPQFARVSIVEKTGREIAQADRFRVVPREELKNYGVGHGFDTMKEGQFALSPIFFSHLGEPFISITTPIISLRGDWEGEVVTELSLRFMWSLVGEISVGKEGKVYVVDEKGVLIADPDSSLVLKSTNLSHRPIVAKLFEGEKAIGGLDPALRYTDREKEMFSTGMLIEEFNWGIITEEPLEDAFSASRRTLVVGTGLSASMLLLFFLLVYAFRRLLLANQFLETERRRVAAQSEELGEKVALLNKLNQELDRNASLLIARDAELTQANAKLRELDKVKSEFLSIAAHQLRTPLSAIKWIFSILLEEHTGKLSNEQKSYVIKGEESNNRMIRLVDDMLTVTRIESGRTEYNFYWLSLHEILNNLFSDFEPNAAKRNVFLEYVPPAPGTPANVMVDPEKIRFVFENLLENSLRYTPAGGKVTISLYKDGEKLVAMIKDTGIGIPKEEQKNIFEKFYRATNAVKAVTDGSGLGLFVAKTIIERHGGVISFESKEGEGTTFRIALTSAKVGDMPPRGASTAAPKSEVALRGAPLS